jgi:hypothetical protein
MDKEPLYRKENKLALNYRSTSPRVKYRHHRHLHKSNESEDLRCGIGGRKKNGMDYTPLYRFLLSRVGSDWDDVYAEAKARLDRTEPIFYLVALHEFQRKATVRCGDKSYYSGLYVDDDNMLRVVAPEITVDVLWPRCPCCTHSFNGQRFVNQFDWNTRYPMVRMPDINL